MMIISLRLGISVAPIRLPTQSIPSRNFKVIHHRHRYSTLVWFPTVKTAPGVTTAVDQIVNGELPNSITLSNVVSPRSLKGYLILIIGGVLDLIHG